MLEDPIRWSTARAVPPRYPHVRLDVDVLSLIPQARRMWLDRSRHHDGCGVVDGVDFQRAGLRQVKQEGEEEREA